MNKDELLNATLADLAAFIETPEGSNAITYMYLPDGGRERFPIECEANGVNAFVPTENVAEIAESLGASAHVTLFRATKNGDCVYAFVVAPDGKTTSLFRTSDGEVFAMRNTVPKETGAPGVQFAVPSAWMGRTGQCGIYTEIE